MAIETIKERMVVVWNEDGSFRGASIDELIRYEDGSTRNAQRPLTEDDADALVGSVDAATIAQLDTAIAAIETLTKERDEALAANAVLQSRIDDLESTPTIPTISSRQGKLILLQAGLLAKVKAAVDAADETVQIYWSDSVEWHRNDTVLVGMASKLGLTDEQLDSLFEQAASL